MVCGATARADFATWGNDEYFVTGVFNPVPPLGDGRADTVDRHDVVGGRRPGVRHHAVGGVHRTTAGYLFVANISDAALYSTPAVVAPEQPGASAPRLPDIDAGGGKITALMSFSDHLLIFKTNSLWALYGYGEDSCSWSGVEQRRLPDEHRADPPRRRRCTPFSASNRGGICQYSGSQPVRRARSWPRRWRSSPPRRRLRLLGRARLWISVPWRKDVDHCPSWSR